jgi:hypothetical protein
MRVFPMFNTTTLGLSIAPPTIAHFRWEWESNPWVPWMLHYLLQPHIQILPMFILRPKKPPDSLSGFNTSTKRSIIFWRNLMLSTITSMINTRYCIIFRWETRFVYIYWKNALQRPIGSSVHFSMGLTLSPRLWETMFFSSTLPPSLAWTQCSMWTSSGHSFQHY